MSSITSSNETLYGIVRPEPVLGITEATHTSLPLPAADDPDWDGTDSSPALPRPRQSPVLHCALLWRGNCYSDQLVRLIVRPSRASRGRRNDWQYVRRFVLTDR